MSLDTDYRDFADNAPRNPNEALYGPQNGNTGSNELGSISADDLLELCLPPERIYALPWGLTYASSLNAQSGDYFVREVQVRDALETNVVIRVEPQAGRYEWTKIWDNRISKRIKTFGNQSLEGELTFTTR